MMKYIYNCFIVVEIKVTELEIEYIGQIIKYMNYIDKRVKTIIQNKTIEIIICKKQNNRNYYMQETKQSLTKRKHLSKQQICFV